MDGGDCGVDAVWNSVAGFDPTQPQNTSKSDETTGEPSSDAITIDVPELDSENKPVLAAYFNLSSFLGANTELVDASHSGVDIVRSAIMTRKNKVLILAFQRNVKRQTFEVSVTVKPQGGSDSIVKVFNVTAGVSKVEEPPTQSNSTDNGEPTSETNSSSTNTTTAESTSQSGHYQGHGGAPTSGEAKVTGHNVKSKAKRAYKTDFPSMACCMISDRSDSFANNRETE
jgi:hypothetical protein